MGCVESIERLDSELASFARAGAAQELRLGQLLEVLGRGAVFELGFSSLGGYAVERCERSVRWAEGARGLARRLEALPELRRAVAIGEISWCMAELLARVATPASEVLWIERAKCRTVRQMRVLVANATAAPAEALGPGGAASAAARGAQQDRPHAAGLKTANDTDARGLPGAPSEAAGEPCTLTCTVQREDAWLFEATRCLLEQLGERSPIDQAGSMLAEAQTTLLALLPRGAVDLERVQRCDATQRAWLEQLQRWREEGEVLCERSILGGLRSSRAASSARGPELSAVVLAASLGVRSLEHLSATVLDREVRALAAARARHELELSRLALRFHRADGWRRLGYASEAQYARERLGTSRSSLRARRTLALHLERLPRVAAALGASQIGVEAASQVVRIATAKTEAAWVERARRRTIKHLREEVAAALVAVRLSGERSCAPPVDAELAAFQALEQTVLSGQFARPPAADADAGASEAASPSGEVPPAPERGEPAFEPAAPVSEERKAWRSMLSDLAAWVGSGCQAFAASKPAASHTGSSAGRVTLRLRMSREDFVWWRGLEAQARRWLPAGMSWLRFLCLSVWHGWGHLIGADVAYGHIYIRDRYRCTSPVCNRRDVTPHHLQFRSAGGSDADDNVASVCTWCHLHGVHGGRICALGTAERIRWELGTRSSPSLIVHGRERMAA